MTTTEIYVLSGFLGAGKTTVLQHLLRSMPDPHDVVVVVNEFGQLGWDGQIIASPGLRLYQLVNGCICCLLEEDLVKTMEEILQEYSPRRILLEASGIADPANLRLSLAGSKLCSRADVAKVVTVVDARMWNNRKALGKLYLGQLQQADHIVVNKTDLLPLEQARIVTEELQHMFRRSIVTATVMGKIPVKEFWQRPDIKCLPSLAGEGSFQEFSSCHVQSPAAIDGNQFLAFLDAAPSSLLRAKGQIRLPDGSSRRFDWVDGHLDWHLPLDDIRGTYLVLIGRNLDVVSLEQRLNSILLPESAD